MPGSDRILDKSFTEFARSVVEDWSGNSAVVALIKLAHDDEPSQPDHVEFVTVGNADEDTLFCIASNTKVFTAAALDQLVRQGKLSWTDRVSDLFPGLDLQDNFASERATLQDVFAHHSGLPRHENSYRWGDMPNDLVNRLKHLKPSVELREQWQYNNQWYIAGTELVSRLSGLSFIDYVNQYFFKPLDMDSSTFTPLLDSEESRTRMATGYVGLPDFTSIEAPFIFDRSKRELEFNAGAGGISSSARDMLKWVKVLIKQHRRAFDQQDADKEETKRQPSGLDQVLHPDGIKQLSAGRSLTFRHAPFNEESGSAYGAGLWTFTYQGETYLKHGGGVPGFTSQVLWSPQRQIGIITLVNSEGNVPDILAYRAFEIALNLPKRVDWNERFLKSRKESRQQWRQRKPKPFTGRLELPLDAYFGRYEDAGYGTIYVCPARQHRQLYERHRSSKECDKVYDSLERDARIVNGPDSTEGEHILYIVKDTIFSGSHVEVRLTSEVGRDKTSWDGQWVTVYPPFEARQETVVAYANELVHVEFGIDDDGVVNEVRLSGVWGAGPEREEVEKELYWKERKFDEPEVVFKRVS
ncbi:hypothetical protein ACM66B_000422 [Microbotryomycetes sp. NB124-2]